MLVDFLEPSFYEMPRHFGTFGLRNLFPVAVGAVVGVLSYFTFLFLIQVIDTVLILL